MSGQMKNRPWKKIRLRLDPEVEEEEEEERDPLLEQERRWVEKRTVRKGEDVLASCGAEELAEEKLLSRAEFSVTNCQLAGDTGGNSGGNNNNDPNGLGVMVGGAGGGGGGMQQGSASTRSTFLMVFSPDKELIASTHGDHNIYVSKVSLQCSMQ